MVDNEGGEDFFLFSESRISSYLPHQGEINDDTSYINQVVIYQQREHGLMTSATAQVI